MDGFSTTPDGRKETQDRYAGVLTRIIAFQLRDRSSVVHEASTSPEQAARLDQHLEMTAAPIRGSEDEDSMLETIHDIVKEFFQSRFSLERDGKKAIFLFVLFSAINEEGSWSSPRSLAPILSSMAWLARLVAFHEVDTLGGGDSGEMYNKLKDEVIQWVDPNQPTVFTWFRSLGSIAATHAMREQPRPAYDVKDGDYIVEGRLVKHISIHDYLVEQRQTFHDMLVDLLRFSGCPELMDVDYGEVRDLLDSTEPGYSFITDKGNAPFKDRTRVFQSMVKTGRFHGTEDGKTVWKRKVVQAWLDRADNLSRQKHLSDHLLCGDTSRGTELSTLVQINGVRDRSLLHHKDRIVHVTQYHKGEQITGQGKAVARSFDPEYSRWTVIYMVWVRFAEHMVASLARGVSRSHVVSFRGKGLTWRADTLQRFASTDNRDLHLRPSKADHNRPHSHPLANIREAPPHQTGRQFVEAPADPHHPIKASGGDDQVEQDIEGDLRPPLHAQRRGG